MHEHRLPDYEQLDPAGIQHETDFWKEFVRSERFLNGWVPTVPTPELSETVRRLLQVRCDLLRYPARVEVLDVGSGPVSILRGLAGYTPVACDPLANHYADMFDYEAHDIDVPWPFAAENVAKQMHKLNGKKPAYEVVHISNALDHVVDVEKALDSLMDCVAPGGWLIVQGFVNEAWHEKWAGFHQHDLWLEGEVLGVRSGGLHAPIRHVKACDVGTKAKKKGAYPKPKCVWAEQKILHALDRNWFVWVLQK